MLSIIVGECITTVLPGQVCSLDAKATECGNFSATTCQCSPGYNYSYRGFECVGMLSIYCRKDSPRKGQPSNKRIHFHSFPLAV